MFFNEFGATEGSKYGIAKPKPLYLNGLSDFEKNDFRPFEGSSDPSILMIFGCAILLYFTVGFE